MQVDKKDFDLVRHGIIPAIAIRNSVPSPHKRQTLVGKLYFSDNAHIMLSETVQGGWYIMQTFHQDVLVQQVIWIVWVLIHQIDHFRLLS